MKTIQIYTSNHFTSIIAKKAENPSLDKNIVRNYKNETGSKEDFLREFFETFHAEAKDVETKEITAKEVRSKDSKSLLKFQESTTNLAGLELAEEILTSRKVEFIPRAEDFIHSQAPAEEVKESKEPESKTPAKEVKKSKSKTPSEEVKEPKKLLKQFSDKELEQILNGARTNKGCSVSFQCKKYGAQRLYGVIKGARLDKRSNFIQYRIEVEIEKDKKEVLGCAWNSSSLEIENARF